MTKISHKYLCCVLFYLTLSILTVSGAFAKDIPLTVIGPNNSNRENSIILASIPFSKGALGSTQGIAVLDKNMQPLPAQFRVLSRWWPHSTDIRWVQAIFQTDTATNDGDGFYLALNSRTPAPENPVQIKQAQNGYVLENGRLKFEITKTGPGLFEKIWIDRNQDGSFAPEEQIIDQTTGDGFLLKKVKYANSETSAQVSGEKLSVTLEESGPVRAVIKVEGRHDNGSGNPFLKFKVRIFMYAGQGDIKVEHTLLNSCAPDQNPQTVYWDGYDYHLTLKHDHAFAMKTKVDDSLIDMPVGTNDYLHIYQDSPGGEHWEKPLYKINTQEAYSFRGIEVQQNNIPVQSGDRSSGWIDMAGDQYAVTMGMPYFWAEAPKGFMINSNGKMSLELWPENFDALHAMTPDVQKTHEFYLSFHTDPDYSPEDHMAKLWHPLLALPSNEWIEKSGAWEEFSAISHRKVGKANFEKFMNARAEKGALGVWNFGANVWEHNSGVFEPPTRYFQNFILSRDYNRFKIARLNARHWRDLRNYHFGVDWETLVLNNSSQAVQNFYQKRVKSKPKARWPVMGVEHTAAKDRVLDYYLTGSSLTAECLAEEAEWIKWYIGHKDYYIDGLKKHGYEGMINTRWQDKRTNRGMGWWTGRTLGWQMRQSMMIYRALGDEDNLSFARYLAFNRAMKNQDLVVGIYNGETKGETKPWMEAIIGVGLAHVYETTREEDILDSLIGLGNFLSDERLVGGGGAPYVWSFGSTHNGGPSNSSNRIPGFLAWLYTKTGQEHFLRSSKIQAQALRWNANDRIPPGSLGFELYLRVSDSEFIQNTVLSPPVEITDLEIEYLENNKVRLSWTAPDNVGKTGRAKAYQVKYADRRIVEQVQQDWSELKGWDSTTFLSHSDISFWAAKNISGEPVPGEPGQKEVFEFKIPSPGPYHFAVKAWDRTTIPEAM